MVDGRPMAISCLVTSEAPLYLFSKDLRILDLEYPQSVVLVWHRGADVLKGEAEAVRVIPWKSGNVLEILRTNMKEIDRRVTPVRPATFASVLFPVRPATFALLLPP